MVLLDRLLAVLLRPRVRRWRRWSFVVTLAVAGLVAWRFGLQSSALLVAARIALAVAVALLALRLGGERGEAVRDLIMHPRLRRFLAVELRVLATIPRALLGRRRAGEFAYHRGDPGLPIALALLPAAAAEAAAFHLLLPHDWLWAHLAAAVLHAYGMVWLLAWGLGSRAYRHRLAGSELLLRNRPFYRATVPVSAIADIELRRERTGERELVLRDGAALLGARGRVDLWLELSTPVPVLRPLGEPVPVTRIAVAVDDPAAMRAAIEAARTGLELADVASPRRAAPLLVLPELAYGAH